MRKLFVLMGLLSIGLALCAEMAHAGLGSRLLRAGARGALRSSNRSREANEAPVIVIIPAPTPAPTPTPTPAPPPTAMNDDLAALAGKCVEAVRNKQIETVYDSFDPEMKARGPAQLYNDQLKPIWDQAEAQMGPFKSAGVVRGMKIDSTTGAINTGTSILRIVPLSFEKGAIDLWVIFNPSKQVSGIRINPPNFEVTVAAAMAAAKARQAANGQEVTVTVGTAPWALPGTLTLPQGTGPFPAIVLVHGSGRQDRDETVGANKPFRDLAQGLALKGIATLRYEKRTLQYALACAGAEKPITVKEEAIDDALAAAAMLAKNAKIDAKRIIIAGHSLGGMLIPRIAQGAPEAAGFIILAGTTRPLEDVILEQTSYLATLSGTMTPETQKSIEAIKMQVAQIKGLQPGAAHSTMFIMGASPEYWLDLKGYDPAEAAKAIAKPLLIAHGGRDYQVTQEDTRRWQAALAGKANVTFKLYPDLNHLFIAGKGKSIPAEYEIPGQVAPAVIDDIAAWVGQVK